MVLGFSLEEQELLSLPHPPLGIQKILLNGQVLAWSFVTLAFVLPVAPINCFRKVWLFLALLREEPVPMVGKI